MKYEIAASSMSSTKPGDIVLDLFGGSGSTSIAAEARRACYMMELEPRYCDVIVKRYLANAGLDAEITCERAGNKVRPPDEWFAERPD